MDCHGNGVGAALAAGWTGSRKGRRLKPPLRRSARRLRRRKAPIPLRRSKGGSEVSSNDAHHEEHLDNSLIAALTRSLRTRLPGTRWLTRSAARLRGVAAILSCRVNLVGRTAL